jgi:hypothetical protein
MAARQDALMVITVTVMNVLVFMANKMIALLMVVQMANYVVIRLVALTNLY